MDKSHMVASEHPVHIKDLDAHEEAEDGEWPTESWGVVR